MRSGRNDRGNITVLSLGFAIFVILLVFVGAAATGVHVDRTRLQHLADELALDVADAMDVGAYYAGTVPRPNDDAAIAISTETARRVAAESLPVLEDRHGLEGVQIVEVGSPDGHTVVVTVSVVVHPLFGSGRLPLGDVTLIATSSARVH